MVLRSLGAPSRRVGARRQSDHLRGGVDRLRTDRGAGRGAEFRQFREAAAALGSRVSRGQVLPALPAARRRPDVHASGLLHRCARRGFGPRSPHAGRGTISVVLPAAGGHFTVDDPSPAGKGAGRQEGPELLLARDDVVVPERGLDEDQPVLPKDVLRDGALRNRDERDVPRAEVVHEIERLILRAPLGRVDVDQLAWETGSSITGRYHCYRLH